MLTKSCKQDSFFFLSAVKRIMGDMGLKILERGFDYVEDKPDLVAIYPDKQKFYMIETLSLNSINPKKAQFGKEVNAPYQIYCKKLFPNDDESANIANAVICNLGFAVEAFARKVIAGYTFSAMSSYAGLAVPPEKSNKASSVLDRLKLDYRPLDILDDFTLLLIAKHDSAKLAENKNFIGFMIANK